MTSINFRFFLENDANPFILFSNTGKIQYLNNAAEILMSFVQAKEVFDITLNYAPKTFGFKKSILNLNFNSFQFYGINVLYEDDDSIGIHLYNKVVEQVDKRILLDGFTSTDINILLQANIELFNMNYKGKLSLFTDYQIPAFQIHQNNFSLLLGKVLAQFSNSQNVEISLGLKLGEKIMIRDKKYAIVSLKLKSEKREKSEEKELKKLADKNFINLQANEYFVCLEIPVIN